PCCDHSLVSKCQDYFSAVARFHDLHRVVDLLERQCMGNDPFQIELARFEDAARAIPGIEDAPARDAEHGRALEDDLVGQVELDHAGWDTQQRDAPAVAQSPKALADSGRMARHFQYDIHAQATGDFEDFLHRVNVARVDDVVRAHFDGDIQAF